MLNQLPQIVFRKSSNYKENRNDPVNCLGVLLMKAPINTLSPPAGRICFNISSLVIIVIILISGWFDRPVIQ